MAVGADKFVSELIETAGRGEAAVSDLLKKKS